MLYLILGIADFEIVEVQNCKYHIYVDIKEFTPEDSAPVKISPNLDL